MFVFHLSSREAKNDSGSSSAIAGASSFFGFKGFFAEFNTWLKGTAFQVVASLSKVKVTVCFAIEISVMVTSINLPELEVYDTPALSFIHFGSEVVSFTESLGASDFMRLFSACAIQVLVRVSNWEEKLK